jgi:hypothetical protein
MGDFPASHRDDGTVAGRNKSDLSTDFLMFVTERLYCSLCFLHIHRFVQSSLSAQHGFAYPVVNKHGLPETNSFQSWIYMDLPVEHDIYLIHDDFHFF